VFKVEPYLRHCLDSILNQTYRNLEILLIDDGSPDKCGQICEEYARADSRIRVFHTANKGLSAARNVGLREARGDYIGFVDSDDWIEPDMYCSLLHQLVESEADISACEIWNEYDGDQQLGHNIQDVYYSGSEAIHALIYLRTYSCVWNKLYKKKCWDDVWFPEGKTFEDVATLYKVFLRADSVSCSSNPLYHYRMRISSIAHENSMNNLMDRWNSHYCRYQDICSLPDFDEKKECLAKMEENLAGLAVNTLFKACELSSKQRDYEYLWCVSSFIRSHFPPLGYKQWSMVFRITLFFSRYRNDAIYAILHSAKKTLYLTKKVNILYKTKKKMLYSRKPLLFP
jgi:glycosyltransferase involved in cell wall biosynthesis